MYGMLGKGYLVERSLRTQGAKFTTAADQRRATPYVFRSIVSAFAEARSTGGRSCLPPLV